MNIRHNAESMRKEAPSRVPLTSLHTIQIVFIAFMAHSSYHSSELAVTSLCCAAFFVVSYVYVFLQPHTGICLRKATPQLSSAARELPDCRHAAPHTRGLCEVQTLTAGYAPPPDFYFRIVSSFRLPTDHHIAARAVPAVSPHLYVNSLMCVVFLRL